MGNLADVAYQSKDGVAIGVDGAGRKSLYVAGTRTAGDWVKNIADTTGVALDKRIEQTFGIKTTKMLDMIDPERAARREKIEKIIEKENIETVYGHSRGGAEVADLKVSDHVEKIGLDAAMIEAENKDLHNYYEGGFHKNMKVGDVFDAFIGQTGQNNEYMDVDRSTFHQVWRDAETSGRQHTARGKYQRTQPLPTEVPLPPPDEEEEVFIAQAVYLHSEDDDGDVVMDNWDFDI